jgi:hypothetical protein
MRVAMRGATFAAAPRLATCDWVGGWVGTAYNGSPPLKAWVPLTSVRSGKPWARA